VKNPFRDVAGRTFLDHGSLWLLELNKFAAEGVETEQQRWLKFFTEGRISTRPSSPTGCRPTK
ncbi:MAG: hypothetical protein R6X17_12250, partial [Candidatus Competibacteraceae bacterium]